MPRYLRESCCDELEHAPNRYTPGFEDGLRKALSEFRTNHKDFIFTRGLRGFKVIDPSPVLPNITGDFNIWGEDPAASGEVREGGGSPREGVPGKDDWKASGSRGGWRSAQETQSRGGEARLDRGV
jgi:hypothetical protein